MVGIDLDNHAIAHSLFQTELDAWAAENITLPCRYIRPYCSDIATIQPDLYLFYCCNDPLSVSAEKAPPIDDYRQKLNRHASKDNYSKE